MIMKQGKFKIESGEMVMSDPCYKLGTWCQGVAEVMNGDWVAVPIFFENRVARLMVYHEDTIANNPAELQSMLDMEFNELLGFTFGVDSGTFGFYDKATYRKDETVRDMEAYDFGTGDEYDKESGSRWYRVNCNQVMQKDADGNVTYKQFGVIPTGAVSESGWGDGSYEVFGNHIDGIFFGFVVEFIEIDSEVVESVTEDGEPCYRLFGIEVGADDDEE